MLCNHRFYLVPERSFTQKKTPDTSRVPPCSLCCCCQVASVMSDSVRPHGLQPTRLLRPWDSPGKNTGVGCHFLLQLQWQPESLHWAGWASSEVSVPLSLGVLATTVLSLPQTPYLPSSLPLGSCLLSGCIMTFAGSRHFCLYRLLHK